MSATPEFRRKYGVYLPHQRFNVDQVPLPFVNGLNDTYEEVGRRQAGLVSEHVFTCVHSDSKHMC